MNIDETTTKTQTHQGFNDPSRLNSIKVLVKQDQSKTSRIDQDQEVFRGSSVETNLENRSVQDGFILLNKEQTSLLLNSLFDLVRMVPHIEEEQEFPIKKSIEQVLNSEKLGDVSLETVKKTLGSIHTSIIRFIVDVRNYECVLDMLNLAEGKLKELETQELKPKQIEAQKKDENGLTQAEIKKLKRDAGAMEEFKSAFQDAQADIKRYQEEQDAMITYFGDIHQYVGYVAFIKDAKKRGENVEGYLNLTIQQAIEKHIAEKDKAQILAQEAVRMFNEKDKELQAMKLQLQAPMNVNPIGNRNDISNKIKSYMLVAYAILASVIYRYNPTIALVVAAALFGNELISRIALFGASQAGY